MGQSTRGNCRGVKPFSENKQKEGGKKLLACGPENMKRFLKLQYIDYTWILIKPSKTQRKVNTYCLKFEKYSFLV